LLRLIKLVIRSRSRGKKTEGEKVRKYRHSGIRSSCSTRHARCALPDA